MRDESDLSAAKQVGLQVVRAGVLEGEQVRLQVCAFKVGNRLIEGSRLIGLVVSPLTTLAFELCVVGDTGLKTEWVRCVNPRRYRGTIVDP